MLPTKEIPKHFNQLLISLWRLIEQQVDKNHITAFHQEDIYGSTDLFRTTQDRLLLVYLGILMELRQYDTDTKEEILERFGGEEKLRKILSCRRVSYNKFIDLLSLEEEKTELGISQEAISKDFEIGFPDFERFYNQMDVDRLLNLDCCCIFTRGNLDEALGYQNDNEAVGTQLGTLIRI